MQPKLTSKLYAYGYDDMILQTSQNGSQFLWDATMQINYELNRKHSFKTYFGQTNKAPEDQNLYTNFILGANRILKNNELNFDRLTTNNFSIDYSFLDQFNDIGAGLGFTYEKQNNAYFALNLINEDVTRVSNFLRDNGAESRRYSASFHKYVSALRSTFRLQGSFTDSNYFNLVNSSNLRENKSETLSANFNMATSMIGKFTFSNNLAYNQSNFTIAETNGFKNESLVNTFDIGYMPKERFRIDADINYNIPNLREAGNRTVNLNGALQYENKKGKISYKLEGKNLLNAQNINRITNTDFSTTSSTNSIFERYFILTASFRF